MNLLSQASKDHIEGSYLLNTTVTLEEAYTAVMIIVMIIAILFLVLVTNLVFIQTKNFMLNQTSSMRLSKFRRSNSFDHSKNSPDYS